MHSFVLLFFFKALGGETIAIRLISITVPKEVIIKGNATFNCNYNIESDQLYSLKWYKRINDKYEEFFSYISGPEKTIHQNSAPGVHLDEQKSSKTGDVLYLYDIDLTSEGSYKCEVSADYTFQTVKLESFMTVLVPPTKPPTIIIHGFKTFYDIGEVVTSYCNVSYSKPKSGVKWFINEEEAPQHYLINSNHSNPAIQFTLQTNHLIDGKLRLRCSAFYAFIDSNFQVNSEETIINGTNELQNVPLIIGLQSNYILGQYLDVNCTMPLMIDEYYETQLEWFIHNEKANVYFVKRYTKNTIGLKFRIKQYHLDDDSNLFIKCSATQPIIPPKTASTFSNKSNSISTVINQFYFIYLLIIYHFIQLITKHLHTKLLF